MSGETGRPSAFSTLKPRMVNVASGPNTLLIRRIGVKMAEIYVQGRKRAAASNGARANRQICPTDEGVSWNRRSMTLHFRGAVLQPPSSGPHVAVPCVLGTAPRDESNGMPRPRPASLYKWLTCAQTRTVKRREFEKQRRVVHQPGERSEPVDALHP